MHRWPWRDGRRTRPQVGAPACGPGPVHGSVAELLQLVALTVTSALRRSMAAVIVEVGDDQRTAKT